MSKDPAILFYTKDFYTGTVLMTDEQVGKYIRLLCIQHQTGHIEEKHMLNICKTYDKDIFSKFVRDSEGLYYNERLEIEIVKRSNYCESRRKNKMSGKTYVEHMGNANANVNVNRKRKSFVIPLMVEVEKYFIDNGYKKEAAINAWHYYNDANWFDSKGNKVLNWKQKMRAVWFKPENKETEQKDMMP